MQSGGNADAHQEKSKEMKKRIQEVEQKEKDVIEARDKNVVLIGNVVHDSVPISDDEVGMLHASCMSACVMVMITNRDEQATEHGGVSALQL